MKKEKFLFDEDDLHNSFIEGCHKAFEDGDTEALLSALRHCWEWELAIPVWVRDAMLKRLNTWQGWHVKTLDEAFRLPARKHIEAERKKRFLSWRLYLQVELYSRLGYVPSSDGNAAHQISDINELFKVVASKFKVNPSFVRESYYLNKNQREARLFSS